MIAFLHAILCDMDRHVEQKGNNQYKIFIFLNLTKSTFLPLFPIKI